VSASLAEPHVHAAGLEAPPQPITSVPGRLGTSASNLIVSLLGPPSKRRLAWAARTVSAVRYYETRAAKFNDEQMRLESQHLRGRARGGESLDRMLPEAFGLANVAAVRILGLRPFDVQIAAAAVMHRGALAELATGEGKTLTAILPAYLNALTGKGVHVTTVNDYLAKRDGEWTTPVYSLLGLSVGILQQKMDDAARTAAYRCDLTYGTASEFGFDFLRDRMKLRGGQAGGAVPFWAGWTGGATSVKDPRVQRPLNLALVDEADSITIDEARTPLIISAPTRPATAEESVVYLWANELARTMKRDVHFRLDPKKDKVELTEAGKEAIRYSNPPSGEHSHAMDKLHEHVERAIQAHHRFVRDQHYMVSSENKIVIIDEFTGRPMPDRNWREGLHQAVEAKEKVPITFAADHAAQITYQNYYRHYQKLGGMSGTIVQNSAELRRVYKLCVVPVPTNRPVKRTQEPDRVFPTEDAKFAAVVDKVRELQVVGRPVLIGTRSVEKSEKLSELLTRAGIEHQVLNARQNEHEAQVVAQAGQPGRVTVATNMAGRGTDIKLGPGVAKAGGLFVIGTERHEAKRIDRQLLGRAGRQGDPGGGQFFLSLEDELLEALGPARQAALQRLGQSGKGGDWQRFAPLFEQAQRKLERKHYRQRLDLMFYDRYRRETLADLGADPFVD
jgi:preprotein translocase subunit SecA